MDIILVRGLIHPLNKLSRVLNKRKISMNHPKVPNYCFPLVYQQSIATKQENSPIFTVIQLRYIPIAKMKFKRRQKHKETNSI